MRPPYRIGAGSDQRNQQSTFVVHPHHIHLLLCNSTEAKYLRPSPIILTTFVLSTSAHFGEMRCGGRRN